jgi:hypothetical protein
VNAWVFRCDYCGSLNDIDKGRIYWAEVERLDNGDILHVPSVFCTPHCGRRGTSRAGTGRG